MLGKLWKIITGNLEVSGKTDGSKMTWVEKKIQDKIRKAGAERNKPVF